MPLPVELKSLHSPDGDWRAFRPDEADCFGFFLQVMVGPSESSGVESFDFTVCTPRWLQLRHREQGPVWGRGFLIVDGFHPVEIETEISTLIARCGGNTWEEFATRLSRYLHWEFADYQL